MSTAKMTHRCPVCREGVRFAVREYVGREIECPACHALLKVNPDGFERFESNRSDSKAVSPATTSSERSGLREVSGVALIGIVLAAAIVVAAQWKLPKPVAIRDDVDSLTERNAPQLAAPSEAVAAEGRDEMSPESSEWEPIDVDESEDVASVTQPPVELLPPPLKERPALLGRNVNPESEEDALNERPIVVPLAIWDPEAEPLFVPIEGALVQRTEDRLAMRLTRFETSRPIAVLRLLQTLADAAGVEIVLPDRGLVGETSLAVSEATIAALLDELLDNRAAGWSIRDDGVVVVSLER